jgi:tetratricopeptide (TPR) repeat protein
MGTSPAFPRDSLLETAQAHAGRNEWAELCRLVESTPSDQRTVDLDILFGEGLLRLGELAEAHALLHGLVSALRGNDPASRRAINMLGAAAFELGSLEESKERFCEALHLASEAGDVLTLGRATNNLGMIAHLQGRYDRALAQYELAVPAYQRLGFTAGLAETHHNMALALRELGRLDQAERNERRAIDYAREAGSRRLYAMAQVGRAELMLRREQAVIAEAVARIGVAEYAAIGDAVGEADAWRVAGAARVMLGESGAAATALDRAVELARSHGSTLIEAEAHEARARLHAVTGDWARLDAAVAAARRLYRASGAVALEEVLKRWHADLPGHSSP